MDVNWCQLPNFITHEGVSWSRHKTMSTITLVVLDKTSGLTPVGSECLTSLKDCSRLLPETESVMSTWCMMNSGSSWLWYGKYAMLSAMNSSRFTSVFCRRQHIRRLGQPTQTIHYRLWQRSCRPAVSQLESKLFNHYPSSPNGLLSHSLWGREG